MKKIAKYLIVFTIIIASFNILQLLGSLFPSTWIENNVKESAQILLEEGNDYSFEKYFKDCKVINNNYTDAIMINTCYSIDNENPFFSYMLARKNYKKDVTIKELEDTQGELLSISSNSTSGNYLPTEELAEFVDGKVTTSIEYARYWHGYLFFLRVMLLLFNVSQIRNILFILFVILAILLFALLNKKFNFVTAVIFAFSLIVQDYFFVSYSLESAPIFITMMIACIILLLRLEKIKDFYVFCFVIGCISNFVDFLTVPLITLAMPLIIYLLHEQKYDKKTVKEYLLIIIKASITWLIGYGATWASKWIIYDMVFHKNLISSAFSQVMYRASSSNPLADFSVIDVIKIQLFNNTYYLMFFALALLNIKGIILLRKLIKNKENEISYISFKADFKQRIKKAIPFIIISLFPLAWYLVSANHTILHIKFAYRHMLIFLVGFLLVFKHLVVNEKQKKLP